MFSESDLNKFVPVPEELQKRSKLSTEANILYAWCWRFYENCKEKGLPFYLNWYQAAVVLHKSPAKAKSTIKELTECGLLVKIGRMPNRSCVYKVVDWRTVQESVLESDADYAAFLATLDKVKGSDSARAEMLSDVSEPEEVSYPHSHAQEATQEPVEAIVAPQPVQPQPEPIKMPQKPIQSDFEEVVAEALANSPDKSPFTEKYIRDSLTKYGVVKTGTCDTLKEFRV